MKIIKFKEITSTNDYLKENADLLDNYDICVADYQTNGRGRMNRKWQSVARTNLMMSILIKDLKHRTNYTNITLLTGCIIHKFLSKYLSNIKIKWPNDLLVNNQKIAGILTEAQTKGNQQPIIIIGIGININQKHFDQDIDQYTTSLAKETGQIYDLDNLINELATILITEIDHYLDENNQFIDYLKQYLYAKNETITYEEEGKIKQAVLIDIDEDGDLIINTNNQLNKVHTGEIKIIR